MIRSPKDRIESHRSLLGSEKRRKDCTCRPYFCGIQVDITVCHQLLKLLRTSRPQHSSFGGALVGNSYIDLIVCDLHMKYHANPNTSKKQSIEKVSYGLKTKPPELGTSSDREKHGQQCDPAEGI